MKEVIHFAHGNGFPALCYTQLFNELSLKFSLTYIDRIGHDDSYPVEDNWHHLVAEILASVRRQANQPVIAVGHSLGGVLSLLAAIEEPKLFKAVILLDSPMIGPFKSRVVFFAKVLKLIDYITPAAKTQGRREYWESHDELLAYLRTRDLFKTFTDACLDDYITYGLEYKNNGFYLRFDRHIEYQIYRTIPHIIPKLKGRLLTPAALIYGDASKVIDRMDIRYMHSHFNIKNYPIKGTHVFPMECPKNTAQHIFRAVDAIV